MKNSEKEFSPEYETEHNLYDYLWASDELVHSAASICFDIYDLDASSPEYRTILKALKYLQKEGFLHSRDMPGHVTVYWLPDKVIK